MLWIVAFAALQATPAIKTCPDGATIKVEENCLVYPDHRRLLASQPSEQQTIIRWRCGTTWAQISFGQGRESSDRPSVRLIDITVNGNAWEGKQKAMIVGMIAQSEARAAISPMCRSPEANRWIPVLAMRYANASHMFELD